MKGKLIFSDSGRSSPEISSSLVTSSETRLGSEMDAKKRNGSKQ